MATLIPETDLPDCVSRNPQWRSFADKLNGLARHYSMHPDSTEFEKFTPQCEICTTALATVYCGQDKAHLCHACDESHHVSSKLLAKHERLPVFHSPFQFGFCQHHTMDRYECVCLLCGDMLCQLCLLVGSHATLSDHPIVSTIEAFRLSMAEDPATLFGKGDELARRTFAAVSEEQERMLAELKAKHAIVVQSESTHWQLQQDLDKELRKALDVLDRHRQKRLDYLSAARRENLIVLTMVEWLQAFAVHARLSLPPSLWLTFFSRIRTSDGLKRLLLGNLSDPAVLAPTEVAEYISRLPGWVTSRLSIEGHIDVFPAGLRKPFGVSEISEKFQTAKPIVTAQFEWVPTQTADLLISDPTPVSPETLRKSRMEARMDELLSQPTQETLGGMRAPSIPFPAGLTNADNPVSLDNVKDFVMQTLAVLAETENRLPELAFSTAPEKFLGADQPPVTARGIQVTEGTSVTPMMTAALVPTGVDFGLPPPAASQASGGDVVDEVPKSARMEAKVVDPTARLMEVLQGGPQLFSNAVAVLLAAPSADRQELVRIFSYLFRDNTNLLEALIAALVNDTVSRIEASGFLVSGVSTLVPITAAFSLYLFVSDFTFLDPFLQDLLGKVIPASAGMTAVAQSEFAEQSIAQFVSVVSVASSDVRIPASFKFLLRMVYNACLARFPPSVALGVVSGLFLARVVSPRLVWTAPKSSGDTQAPPIITQMTRYLHRLAGAAAEGSSMLSGGGTEERVNDKVDRVEGQYDARDREKPGLRVIRTCISQTNGLMMREVVMEPEVHLPPLTGGITTSAAAERIERKIRDYGCLPDFARPVSRTR